MNVTAGGLDVLLVGFIAGMIWAGWRSGFIRRLLGITFIVIAFLVGAYLRYPIGALSQALFKNIPTDYANLVGYAIAFPVILVALHLGANAVASRIPASGVSRELDKGLGALLGAIEALIIISVVVVIVDTYFGTSSNLRHTVGFAALTSFANTFNASTTVHILRDTIVPLIQGVVSPLLPTNLRSILPNGIPGLPTQTGPGGIPIPGVPGLPVP
jgi:uncharacterized membrane protein required for colicin V production